MYIDIEAIFGLMFILFFIWIGLILWKVVLFLAAGILAIIGFFLLFTQGPENLWISCALIAPLTIYICIWDYNDDKYDEERRRKNILRELEEDTQEVRRDINGLKKTKVEEKHDIMKCGECIAYKLYSGKCRPDKFVRTIDNNTGCLTFENGCPLIDNSNCLFCKILEKHKKQQSGRTEL